MSGSGGGGITTDVFQEACESLVIDTQLSSPKDNVVNLISEGDVLDVSSQKMAGTSVVVVLHQGEVAGGLASPKIQRLRECIEQGTQYSATVTSKKEGQVRVRVMARRL